MPVPPQESAPSLSPRQSFGCQSPLPWVTGTDRTGILWALWQLQGFLPGVLFSLCALSHLEESLHRPTSLTQSSTAWSQQSTQNTDKCFPKRFSCHRIISGMISEQRLHAQASSAFPKQPGILPLEFNTGFRFKKCAHGISKRQTQTHSSGQECTRFPQANTANGFRDESGYPAEVVPAPHTEVWFRMEARAHSWLSSGFLFACTRVDTCHPGNCMCSIRTPFSHHLGNHGPFQRT
jgi:hypothetical protein